MKATNILSLISLFFLFYISSYSQPPDPLDFFPHHIGDKWEYQHFNGNPHLEILNLTRDSVDVLGNHFIFYNNNINPTHQLDTISFTVLNIYFNTLIYQLDAEQGDVWETGEGASEKWAWIDTIYSASVFGQPSIIKTIKYGPAHPDTFGTEFYLRERKIASGFGLIYEWEEGPWFKYLKGCVINNDTFGIITNIENEVLKIPNKICLSQNYPNPFNPFTIIEYNLTIATNVQLTIYDLAGKRVKTLVNNKQSAGIHWIQFDGSNLSSGIYLYRLKTDKGVTLSNKMILLK